MAPCTACGDSHPEGAAFCPRTGESLTAGPCGKTIDRYEIKKLLGSGGFGGVYLAEHTMLRQPVALKLEIDKDKIKFIPANIEGQIRATTVFGAKFVDLVYPEDPQGQLQAGQVIESRNVTVLVNHLLPAAPSTTKYPCRSNWNRSPCFASRSEGSR